MEGMAENGEGEAKKMLTMKLLVDKKSNKVLYGEAGKEFVDFLVNLLTLPIGTVAKLLEGSGNDMVGCAAKIYKSIETIDASYLYNDQDKNNLLHQLTLLQSPANSASTHLLLEHKNSTPKKYYQCANSGNSRIQQCNNPFSDARNVKCPGCQQPMTKELLLVEGEEDIYVKGGIVKGVVSYMVMDDLSITPLSLIAGITILNKFNVVVRDLEEKTVEIGMQEGLMLLKASLQSKTALSDVFLMNKEPVDSDRFSAIP